MAKHIDEIDKELAEYGLKIRYSDDKDREPIDFSIEDSEDNIAWVWGAKPDDVDWECNHYAVEFEDDELQGECPICGSYCDWHWETSGDDGVVIKEQVPHTWYPRKEAGGIIKEILEYYKATW